MDLRNDRRLHPPTVILVDGYEQLSRWNRLVLKRFCRRRKLGLLVTTHAPAGFFQLYQTAPTIALAEQIIGELLAGRPSPFTSDELAACYARHRADLRETLFELYDLYEHRRPIVKVGVCRYIAFRPAETSPGLCLSKSASVHH